MQITEADWERLEQHVGTQQRRPPRAVYTAVAALAPPGDIAASWATFDGSSETTVWSHWIVTPTLIGHSELKFAATLYDQDEEADGFHPNPVAAEVSDAWVRPLSSVARFSFTSLGHLVAQEPGWWFLVSGVSVRFSDGLEVSLPDPGGLYQPNERQRWDRFIEAIRAGLRLSASL